MVQNHQAHARRRSSAAPGEEGRRRMPRIPARRSASRQSSFNDADAFEGYRTTPDNCSHRGASLPPTPTRTTRIPTTRLAAQSKPFNSLPPTPGRQLPRPNLNRSRRNNAVKRTSSADYGDGQESYDNCYVRPGAVSYNEDYNYAYRSIDNLQAEEVADVTGDGTVANANYLRQEVAAKEAPFAEDYYYNQAREYDDYEDSVPPRRKRLLGKRDASPLLQQNTDSLESRDDELKDSFETAVSSMSSSLHQVKSSPYVDAVLANTTPAVVAAETLQKTSMDQHQNKTSSVVLPSVTVAQVHNNVGLNRGMLKQQDSVEGSFYQQQVDSGAVEDRTEYVDTYNEYDESTGYLEQQESVESYVEEETEGTITNGR